MATKKKPGGISGGEKVKASAPAGATPSTARAQSMGMSQAAFIPQAPKPSSGSSLGTGSVGPAIDTNQPKLDPRLPVTLMTQQQGGGDTSDMTEYETFLKQQAEQAAANERKSATEAMKGVLESLGLSSLYTRVVDYIRDGYTPDAIMVLLRTTPEYKQRFPAMDALAKKGRAISEAEYIGYEQTAAGLERRYGLPSGMLMGNVTRLLENEVSAAELNDRVLLANAAAIQAPQDLRDTFSRYYNVDMGGMTAYFLDPAVATPLLEKQYASSVIGTEAARQGVGINAFSAENLADLGISQDQARQGFGNVARQSGLTQGRGDIVSQDTLIKANLAGDEQAASEVDRVVGGRLGRFEGGGEFLTTNKGAVGLGSSSV